MTSLPPPSPKKLGLVIDLDTCVGCHACAVSCKEWNSRRHPAPLTDHEPYGKEPRASGSTACTATRPAKARRRAARVHFPRSCLHCDTPACVTVCPTGACYKRGEDGIVLVDEDKCIGCGLCAWACPYGAREMRRCAGVMKKCTLCIDRIYNENLPEADRDAGLRRRLPDQRAAFRRPRRSRSACRSWSPSAGA